MNWVYLALAILAFIEFSNLIGKVGHVATALHRIANSYDIWAVSVLPPSQAEEDAVKKALASSSESDDV